jgi:hypothetical protein
MVVRPEPSRCCEPDLKENRCSPEEKEACCPSDWDSCEWVQPGSGDASGPRLPVIRRWLRSVCPAIPGQFLGAQLAARYVDARARIAPLSSPCAAGWADGPQGLQFADFGERAGALFCDAPAGDAAQRHRVTSAVSPRPQRVSAGAVEQLSMWA